MNKTNIIKKLLKMSYVIPMLFHEGLACYHYKAFKRNENITGKINRKVLTKYNTWGYFE